MQSSAHRRVFSDRVRLILLTIGSGSAGGKTLDPGLNLELESAVLVRQNRGEQVLTPFDDYPVHQTALPIAHAGGGHPDYYDRFWFNGYTEDYYFAVALGLYPNRGVIDAAFGVVHDGWQRSVFASGRMPLDPTQTRVGPISVDITEPLRVNRVRVDAADLGITADLTFRARTAAFSEPRQTLLDGTRPVMDVTRLAQLGQWSGSIGLPGGPVILDSGTVYGTKDRSWGIRPVGQPAAAAPSRSMPQIFFLWAPLNFASECLHFMTFEHADGKAWAKTAAVLPVIAKDAPVYGPGTEAEPLEEARHHVDWAPGLRRSQGAALTFSRAGEPQTVQLEPVLTFRMRGAGYMHPTWGHGRWHDELAVAGEQHRVEELDTLDPTCIHVQQVVRATWGERAGLGVLEQLAIGPHAPSGFRELFDGAAT
jgi:hypothetical protein